MKKSLLKILSNNWLAKLSATLIGVFVALYLNQYVADRKVQNRKSIATQNVLIEISANKKSLDYALEQHIELWEIVDFTVKHKNDSGEFILHSDSMKKFRAMHPYIIQIEDSVDLGNNIFQYKGGKVNYRMSVSQIELTSVAWNTIKNSDLNTAYDFDCLMFFEQINMAEDEVINDIKITMEFFTGEREMGERKENLLRHLGVLITKEQGLLQFYEVITKNIEECG